MPRKGMRSIFSSSSRSSDHLSSPSFSTARTSFVESIMIQTLQQTELIISKQTTLFHENNRGEAKKFVSQVRELHKAMESLVSEDAGSKLLVTAHNLMQVAMKRLQKEFHRILSTNHAFLSPDTVSARSSLTSSRTSLTSTRYSMSDYGDDSEDETRFPDHMVTEFGNASRDIMADLKFIADCMISCGYGKECVNIYVSIRKSIVDEGMHKLGVDKESLSKKFRKLEWEVLDLKIKNWLNAVNVATNTLFRTERILCDQVFAASNSISGTCFNAITKEAAIILFEFPENVMKNKKKSSVKIFRTLDMYTAIANQWSKIESIFSFDSTYGIINQAINSTTKLGDYIRSALTDFEASIQKDSSKNPVAGARVHKLTTNVMNFLSLLADYNVLRDILIDSPRSALLESYYNVSDSDDSPEAPVVSRRFALIIIVLLSKVERKAKKYKDVSLSSLFLANNLNYIVSKARTSNLKYLLSEDWISKHERKSKYLPPITNG